MRTAGAVAALGLTLALAACGGGSATLTAEPLDSSSLQPDPTAPATPSASAPASTPTPSASTAATASVEPSPDALATLDVDGLAEVLVSDLVVRTAPGVDPATSSILADRLTTGDRVFVVDGPVADAGYAWYLVAPLFRADDSVGPFGWIAMASREGEAWVRAVEAPCPVTADLASVLGLQPLERLACFGDETLTLTASDVSCGAGGGPWTVDPSWIGVLGGCGLADGSDVLLVRTPPGGTPISSGPATVRGHFDDPAAATCTITSADPGNPAPAPEHAVLLCRTEFVSEG